MKDANHDVNHYEGQEDELLEEEELQDELEETEAGTGSTGAGGDEEFVVAEANGGDRIDKLVAERRPDLSRTQAQDLIDEEHILVNGKKIKSNYKVKAGDVISIAIPALVEPTVEAEDIPLDVRYEDGDVIVVNKPRGMVVHPAAGHYSGTLVNALLYHCKDLSGINGEVRPGIVHRIDKDTSGLLMAAKNDHAHRHLAAQLKEHTVTRKYFAVVHGVIPHDIGTVDAPIGRHTVHRQQMAVMRDGGREAVTHFQVIERLPKHTVVELKLETGRTHQIRVHMEFIGHPLVGDPKYGNQKRNKFGDVIDGQALHAQTLGFIHPRTEEYLEFSTDIPDEMKRLIELLRQIEA